MTERQPSPGDLTLRPATPLQFTEPTAADASRDRRNAIRVRWGLVAAGAVALVCVSAAVSCSGGEEANSSVRGGDVPTTTPGATGSQSDVVVLGFIPGASSREPDVSASTASVASSAPVSLSVSPSHESASSNSEPNSDQRKLVAPLVDGSAPRSESASPSIGVSSSGAPSPDRSSFSAFPSASCVTKAPQGRPLPSRLACPPSSPFRQ